MRIVPVAVAAGEATCAHPGAAVYVKSAAECGYEPLVVTWDTTEATRERLRSWGARVSAEPRPVEGPVCRARWQVLLEHLGSLRRDLEDAYLVITDFRDVLFQRPIDEDILWSAQPRRFDVVEAAPESVVPPHWAAFVSEGFKIAQCPWNRARCQEVLDNSVGCRESMEARWALNGGSLVGAVPAVLQATVALAAVNLARRNGFEDQSALNWVAARLLTLYTNWSVFDPRIDRFCFTGHVEEEPAIPKFPYAFDELGRAAQDGQLYGLFHQYDRIDRVRDTIFGRYAS
jgi:hypothetical protein